MVEKNSRRLFPSENIGKHDGVLILTVPKYTTIIDFAATLAHDNVR